MCSYHCYSSDYGHLRGFSFWIVWRACKTQTKADPGVSVIVGVVFVIQTSEAPVAAKTTSLRCAEGVTS